MKNIVLLTFLLIIAHGLHAQINTLKKDTIYYVVDTAATPSKERMFIVGSEGRFYGYRLTCSCYPWQTDPSFIYQSEQKGMPIDKSDINNLNLITLRQLIQIAAKFGKDKITRNVYYFIEKQNESYVKHQVFLSEPIQPTTGY